MNKVYLVSRCKENNGPKSYFDFIGYIEGRKITEVCVYGGKFLKDEEYFIVLSNVIIKGHVLSGKFLKCKQLWI